MGMVNPIALTTADIQFTSYPGVLQIIRFQLFFKGKEEEVGKDKKASL